MASISIRDSSLFTGSELVAYYEVSAGALTTDSKASYTLTNTNTVADGTGNFGGAADFGSTDADKSLSVASNLGIAGSGDIGISLWVKMNVELANNLLQLFVNHTSTTTADRQIQIYYHYPTGDQRYIKLDSAGTTISSAQILGTSNWHHIVANRISGATELFVDGSSVGTSTSGTTGTATDTFVIGNSTAGGTSFQLFGLIDDVAVFNRGLTTAEVVGIYNGTLLPTTTGMPFISL